MPSSTIVLNSFAYILCALLARYISALNPVVSNYSTLQGSACHSKNSLLLETMLHHGTYRYACIYIVSIHTNVHKQIKQPPTRAQGLISPCIQPSSLVHVHVHVHLNYQWETLSAVSLERHGTLHHVVCRQNQPHVARMVLGGRSGRC